MLRILGVAVPQVGDSDSAAKACPAIHDQHLAVGPVVHARQVVPVRLVKFLDSHAAGLHLVQQRCFHLPAADPVQKDMNLDAGARALRERVGELLPGRARPVDIGLESDAVARAPDGLQHRGENAVAVQQHLESVAGHDRRAQQHAHAAQKIRILDSIEPLDPLFDLRFAGGEIQRQDDSGKGHARGAGDDRQPAGCLLHPEDRAGTRQQRLSAAAQSLAELPNP